MSHSFEQVQQDSEGHGHQHKLFQRLRHTELAGQCGKSEKVGAQRVLESHPRELIGGEGSRGDDVDKRKL